MDQQAGPPVLAQDAPIVQPYNHPSHQPPPPMRTNGYQPTALDLMNFGRLDSDYTIVDHAVNINGQDTLPGMTYDQQSELTTIDLPIDRLMFIRVWKTLILKRLQDVFEQEKRVRAQHFVRLARNQLLPAPLADLLYALGSFHSPATGVLPYDTTCASRSPRSLVGNR